MPTGHIFGWEKKKHPQENLRNKTKPVTKTFCGRLVSNFGKIFPQKTPATPGPFGGLLMQRLQLFVLFDPAMKHTQMPRGRLSVGSVAFAR